MPSRCWRGPSIAPPETRNEAAAKCDLSLPALYKFLYKLHGFKKTTRKTGKADLDLATKRYRELVQELDR